jgi:Tfp pilus assembly protein FimT
MRCIRFPGLQVFRCSGWRNHVSLRLARPEYRRTRMPEYHSRAFTLIEMLVLIIILAVLSSILVPASARSFAKARYQHSVQDVVGMLTYARNAAIDSNAESVVRFDAQTDTFVVTVETSSPSADLPTAMQETQEAVQVPESRVGKLADDIMVADFRSFDQSGETSGAMGQRMAELRFHEDGSSAGGQFVLRSADGYASVVEVAPMTGRATATDAADYVMGRS